MDKILDFLIGLTFTICDLFKKRTYLNFIKKKRNFSKRREPQHLYVEEEETYRDTFKETLSKYKKIAPPQPISIKEGEPLSKYENCYFDVLDSWTDELKITANGRYLLSRDEKTVKIWDVEQNRVVKVYENIENLPLKEQKFLERFSGVEYDEKHSDILIERDYPSIEMSDKENSRWKHIYYSDWGGVYFVEKKEGSRSYMLFDDWNKRGKLFIEPLPHSFAPTLFDESQSSNYIFSKSKEESLEIWKRERERLNNVEELHEKYINCVAISQDKKYMVSGAKSCYDDEHSCLNLWDLEKGKLIKSFEEARDIIAVSIAIDGSYIVSGSGDDCDGGYTYLQIWDRERLLYSIVDSDKWLRVSSVGISLDGKHIFSECYESLVICTDKGSREEEIRGDKYIWDIEQLKGFKTLSGDVNELSAVTVSEDKRYLVSASRTGIVSVWDRERHQLIEQCRLYEEIKSLSISSDNRYIGLVLYDKIEVWDREEQKLYDAQHEAWKSMKIDKVETVYSNYHNFLYSYFKSKSFYVKILKKYVELWDIEAQTILKKKIQINNEDSIDKVSLSSDERYMVSGRFDGTVRLWDIEKEELIYDFIGHTARVKSLYMTANNQEIISGSADGTVKVWSVESGELLQEYIVGKEGNWLIRDFEAQKVYKGDNGNFLFEKKEIWREGESVVFEVEKLELY